MGRVITRAWRYLTALFTGKLHRLADPRVQLEQAMRDAHEQHRRLRDQAANVIANQKQIAMRQSRALDELERVTSSAHQAVLMAADAERMGETEKASRFNVAAESFANRLIAVEQEISELEALNVQALEAADQAKTAVAQNAVVLQRKLAERARLLGAYDQARLAEEVNRAMSALSETTGARGPTLDDVRVKIETRYARAQATAELDARSVERQMLEVDRELTSVRARQRLAQIRADLGLVPETRGPEVFELPGDDGSPSH